MWLKSKAIWGGIVLIATAIIGVGDPILDADPASLPDWNHFFQLFGEGLAAVGIRMRLPKPGGGS